MAAEYYINPHPHFTLVTLCLCWRGAFTGAKTSLIIQSEHTPDSLAHTCFIQSYHSELSYTATVTDEYSSMCVLLSSVVNFFVKSCTAQSHFAALILILSYRTAGHP